MSQPIFEAQPIEYAAPAQRPPARTFAATVILFGGLALIVLGGCFLIGILMTMEHINFNGVAQQQQQPQAPLSGSEIVFIFILSILALAAFAGAVVLLVLGVRSLLRVTRS